ncbi:DUF6445 family protein [uncultured Brevundimonas sp.]|uniref:DUF6445 family protein n=1 Tax=uncultured Brevundimonas sp. TaxID=213418 RepID=UPI0025E1EDF7|nr:DUF6445 family protein [uncultured Brevundimonas sp.]
MASRRPPNAGGTPIFERIAVYAPVFNRALIYRGSLLFCAMMPANTPLLANPAEGRLTVANILSVKELCIRQIARHVVALGQKPSSPDFTSAPPDALKPIFVWEGPTTSNSPGQRLIDLTLYMKTKVAHREDWSS